MSEAVEKKTWAVSPPVTDSNFPRDSISFYIKWKYSM